MLCVKMILCAIEDIKKNFKQNNVLKNDQEQMTFEPVPEKHMLVIRTRFVLN